MQAMPASPADHVSDLETSAAELQKSLSRSLILAIAGLSLLWQTLGAPLWSDAALITSLPVTLVAIATSAVALSLLDRDYPIAHTIWQVGLLVVIGLAAYLSSAPDVLLLYAFLPLMAITTRTWQAGLLVGIAEILVMAWLGSAVFPEPLALDIWGPTVAGGLVGALIGWVITHTLLTVTQWALVHYEKAQIRMEEVSRQRLESKEVQQDLMLANQELARLSDRLTAMYRVAEEARRAKEEFVANVSHELRTPLNMIIGFSEMITQSPQIYGPGLPPALLSDISTIQRNSQHLSKLVDDVLDLSQVEAGRMNLTKEWVSLQEVIAEATLTVRPLYESKGLYLESQVAENLPEVLCDSTRVSQVVINLLSNAGRFTEQGGVRLCALLEGNNVHISVTDTGPGIAIEDQKKLFEPFQQLDGSIRRQHGGSGLGLNISKRFVEMHGGEMWLESQPGQGTTFHVSLPIEIPIPAISGKDQVSRWFSPYHPYEERTRRSRAPTPEPAPRLVVLDAYETLPRLFRHYTRDVEIISAESYDQALKELGHSPAQALVANLPPGEQAAFADQLSDLPYGTPAITCWVPGEDEIAHRLGVVRYLVKPIATQQLLTALVDLGPEIETVLIADDEPEALQLFARMLSTAPTPYRILRARNGHRALSLMRDRQPDAVLLDLIMPQMDGFQVLEAKRQDPDIQEIPVIIISSRDPSGEPIVSNTLSLAGSHGLSIPEILACTQAVSEILTPTGPHDRAHPGTPAD